MDWSIATRIALEEVDSTSTYLRGLLGEQEPALPVLVTARRQTAGRGQRSNRWFSDAGSLTFTIGLDPATIGLRDEHWPRLALATAVAVVDTLESLCVPPGWLGIRWPNDVEGDGRKVAGILPEGIATAAGRRLAIGVGLNLATRLDDAPAEVRAMATSVAERVGRVPDHEVVLSALIDRLGSAWSDLTREDQALTRRWSALDTLRGEVVTMRLPGAGEVTGRAIGIGTDGALRLATEAGERSILAGQVLRQPR